MKHYARFSSRCQQLFGADTAPLGRGLKLDVTVFSQSVVCLSRHSPVRKGIETLSPWPLRSASVPGADTAPLGRGLKHGAVSVGASVSGCDPEGADTAPLGRGLKLIARAFPLRQLRWSRHSPVRKGIETVRRSGLSPVAPSRSRHSPVRKGIETVLRAPASVGQYDRSRHSPVRKGIETQDKNNDRKNSFGWSRHSPVRKGIETK